MGQLGGVEVAKRSVQMECLSSCTKGPSEC
jgi:hypothetical protein